MVFTFSSCLCGFSLGFSECHKPSWTDSLLSEFAPFSTITFEKAHKSAAITLFADLWWMHWNCWLGMCFQRWLHHYIYNRLHLANRSRSSYKCGPSSEKLYVTGFTRADSSQFKNWTIHYKLDANVTSSSYVMMHTSKGRTVHANALKLLVVFGVVFFSLCKSNNMSVIWLCLLCFCLHFTDNLMMN